jgi:hypothetical protein
MTTNATLRTEFTFFVDDNTLGVALQRIQQVTNDGVPLAAYMQIKMDQSNACTQKDYYLNKSKATKCNLVKLVPGTTTTNTSNDAIYVNRTSTFLDTLGIYFNTRIVVQVINAPQTIPGQPGFPSSINDTLSCPPDAGTSIQIDAMYLGANNTFIVEVPQTDVNRAYIILNNGQANTCTRNSNLIKNCDPYNLGCEPCSAYIPFDVKNKCCNERVTYVSSGKSKKKCKKC